MSVAKRASPKWYVQEDQKIKGPYSPQEIQGLLNEGKIRGKSLVSGGPKNNHSKTVNDLVKPLSDPVYSLFNALQFARNLTLSLSQELAKAPLKRYQSKVGIILWVGFFIFLLLIGTTLYLEMSDFGSINPFSTSISLPKKVPVEVIEPLDTLNSRNKKILRTGPVPRSKSIVAKPVEKPVEKPMEKPVEQAMPEEKPQNFEENSPPPPLEPILEPNPDPNAESNQGFTQEFNREPSSVEDERPMEEPPVYQPEAEPTPESPLMTNDLSE